MLLFSRRIAVRAAPFTRSYAVVRNEKQIAEQRMRQQKQLNQRKESQHRLEELQQEADAFRRSPSTMDVPRAMQYIRAFNVGRSAHCTTLCLNMRVVADKGQQSVSGTVKLPHTFHENQIWVCTSNAEQAARAREAGATRVGSDDIIDLIRNEKLDTDTLIVTPEMMSRILPHARYLGPKGLMPSPKRGTVSTDVREAVLNAKTLVKFAQKNEDILVPVGLASFSDTEIVENVLEVVTAVKKLLPKGTVGRTLLTSEFGGNISLVV